MKYDNILMQPDNIYKQKFFYFICPQQGAVLADKCRLLSCLLGCQDRPFLFFKNHFMFTYSKKLREECIAFFSEECNIDIDHETADIYLDSFADLYTGMKNLLNDE